MNDNVALNKRTKMYFFLPNGVPFMLVLALVSS